MPIKVIHKNAQREDAITQNTQLFIDTKRGEVYQLVVVQTGQNKPSLKTELRKKDLWIRNTEDHSVVIFKNYSDSCAAPKNGETDATEPCHIITDTAFSPDSPSLPNSDGDALLSANTLKILGGVALLGGIAAAVGGGSGGSSPDTTAPTLSISSNTHQLKSKEVALLQFTFSENVSNFTADDVQIEHGTLINFTGSGAHYTATFVPHKFYTGSAAIRVDSHAAYDAAGNMNLDGEQANNAIALILDLVAPTISIHTEKSHLLMAETSLIHFNLSETVNDFDLNDITVIGGTLSQFTGSGTQYTAVFTADNQASIASISVDSKVCTDAAGNFNIDGVDTNNQLTLNIINSSSVYTVNEEQEGLLLSLATPKETQWQLSGADAALFTINTQGEVVYAGATPIDFEQPNDVNADGVYQFIATATTNGTSQQELISLHIQDKTEIPDWMGSADSPVAYGTSNAGVQSLLSNDYAYSTWMDNQAVNPAVAPTLTYAFQNIGALFHTSTGDQAVADEYNTVAKTFIRSVFDYVTSLTHLSFVETDDQSMNGADIRLFADTYEHLKILNVGENTAAFAYQPYGQTYSQSYDYMGNMFLITDTMKLSDPIKGAFLSDFGYEKYVVSHELAHALGLDHPFKDWGGTDDRIEGFYSYDSTSANSTTSNRVDGITGGGHDTPLTDTPMETLMTYHSPQRNLEYKLTHISTNRTAPWEFGIYDIAALQHLYGANTSSHAGDDVYTFDSNTPLYRTLWDGGGTDTMVQLGAQNAYINLNEGTLSRLGLLPTWEIHFAYNPDDNGKVIAVNIADASTGTATIDADGYGIKFKGHSGFDGHLNLSVTMEKNDKVWTEDYPDMYDIVADSYFNVGIAFGVTIENAIGGAGNDTLIGNLAPNQLTGGAGNDVLSGGAAGDVFIFEDIFGNDTITDFTRGQDHIQLSLSMQNAVTFTNGTLNVAGFGNIHLTGVDTLTAGIDYLFV